MSQLQKYIETCLKNEYDFDRRISKNAVNELNLYTHKKSGKKIILIKSAYRNDDVFRILKNMTPSRYLPVIYEVASEENYLLVLEEYIQGEALDKVMQNELSLSQIKQIMIDLCEALEVLHAKKIVHRDIKPENIVITDTAAVLIDFGIAKIINSREEKDTVNLGTIGYAAPEQFGFSQSMPATDIYALGVLANELILGVHPTVKVPKGKIGKIINKCTSTQISARYQTATQLKKAIKRI